MIKTKLFVQLPSVCTVIQYVYNYIHVHETFLQKDGIIYATAPRVTLRSVFLHHHNIFNTKQNMFYLIIPVASSFISKK